MGRKTSIDALPPEIQQQLQQRLIESGFSDYCGHEAWLAELGFQVGKSSIHRLGKSIQFDRDADLRLRCADVASRYSTADTIIANATALMRWVRPPRS